MTPLKWLTGIPMPYYFLTLALVLQLLPGVILSVSQAQGTPPPEGLTIGQPVPDNLELEMVNYHVPKARLSDFKGKLLILDFYATWCSSSRVPMPRLDSLQQEFGDKLQVLLVSYTSAQDSTASVLAYLENLSATDGTRFSLPSVVNDTELVKLFPHKRIPHFAWITPAGKVGAITDADKVTSQAIRQALQEGKMPESLLKDIDLSQPLFATGTTLDDNLLHYSILLKGKVDDGSERMQLRRQGGAVNGVVFANAPLLNMYQILKRRLYPWFGDKGLVLAVADSAGLFREKSSLTPAAWKARHTYAYDLLLPPGRENDLYPVMLQDLNTYSGYRATLEMWETDCLLLVRKGRKDKMKSKGGKPENRLFGRAGAYMQNMPLTLLVGRLNSNNTLEQFVIDETNYKGTADIKLEGDLTHLPTLRKQLQAYGLDLVAKRRKAPQLVLRESPVAGNRIN